MEKRDALMRIIESMDDQEIDDFYKLLFSVNQDPDPDPDPKLKENKNRKRIANGLYIFKQPSRSKNWQVRLSIKTNGKTVVHRFTTGTDDEEAAKSFAIEQRPYRTGQADVGYVHGQNTKHLFKTVAARYIEQLESMKGTEDEKTTHSGYMQLLRDYILPEFGNSNIYNIKTEEIAKFLNKNKSNLSSTRVTMQKTVISQIYELAIYENLINKSDIPDLPKKKKVNIKDPDNEWEPILDTDLKTIRIGFESFIENGRTRKTKHYRKAAKHYFEFCINTGVRPGEEPLSITFDGIQKKYDKKIGKHYYVAKITKGKVNTDVKSRLIILENEAVSAIEHVAQILANKEKNKKVQLHSIDHLINTRGNDYVFKSYEYNKFPPYGSIISKDQLFDYLDEKLIHKRYVSYCMRHTYINHKLIEDATFNEIADQCGTSYQMIENHYKKRKAIIDVPRHAMKNVGGERPRSITESIHNKYGDKTAEEVQISMKRDQRPEVIAAANKLQQEIAKHEDEE